MTCGTKISWYQFA